jgi:SAM-dependent methyltransferase
VLAGLKTRLFPPHREMASVRATLEDVLRERVGSATSVLDVGCGDGVATRRYAAALGVPAAGTVGVEPQDKYRRHLTNFQTEALDIEREPLPFADQSFDVVICNQVLEHLKIVLVPLREMARVTREGGWLVLGVPNLSALISRLFLLVGRSPISLAFPGPHVRGFTHRDLTRFLRANPNFRLEATRGVLFYPVPTVMSATLARRFPGAACYILCLLRKLRHAPEHDWPPEQFPDESLTG